MTKKIRIMNADTSQLPVRVRTQYRTPSGHWRDESSFQINNPADMNEQHIHSTRRVIIEEAEPADVKDQYEPGVVTNDMVSRFLSWPLPADFNPDGGILFEQMTQHSALGGHHLNRPTGTNLLNAEQARAMIAHILGIPNDKARMNSVRMELNQTMMRDARPDQIVDITNLAQSSAVARHHALYGRQATSSDEEPPKRDPDVSGWKD